MNDLKDTPVKKGIVNPVPRGYHTVTPYLVAKNAAMLIDFIRNAFNGEVTYNLEMDGKIMHATVVIGDSIIMISDAMEGMEPVTGMLYLYMKEVDSVFEQAIKSRGTAVRQPMNEPYGDRSACIRDAWNNTWWIATHIEDMTEEEIKERMEEFRKNAAKQSK